MKLPETKAFKFRILNQERPKPSIFITGPPGIGKTLLGYELIVRLSGGVKEDVLVIEFPMDEEGAETLRDSPGPWVKIETLEALDELYEATKVMKPSGILMDNIPAGWWMAYMDRFPSGVMPEDFGKSWNALFADVAYKVVTRFKMHPWIKCFVATSLVWTTEDAFTPNQVSQNVKAKDKVEKLQATLPGQLKGNIYGLFSYALNLKPGGIVQGQEMRVIETRASSSVVAKVRAPIAEQPAASILYDLAKPATGIEHVVKALKLI